MCFGYVLMCGYVLMWALLCLLGTGRSVLLKLKAGKHPIVPYSKESHPHDSSKEPGNVHAKG